MSETSDIITLEEGLLDFNTVSANIDTNRERRLFITNDPSKIVCKSKINKQTFNYKYQNSVIYFDDLEYIIPFKAHTIVLDFEPLHDEIQELTAYCCCLYLWENMDNKKILNLNLSSK